MKNKGKTAAMAFIAATLGIAGFAVTVASPAQANNPKPCVELSNYTPPTTKPCPPPTTAPTTTQPSTTTTLPEGCGHWSPRPEDWWCPPTTTVPESSTTTPEVVLIPPVVEVRPKFTG